MSVLECLRGVGSRTVYTNCARLYSFTIRTVDNVKYVPARHKSFVGVHIVEKARQIFEAVNETNSENKDGKFKEIDGMIRSYKAYVVNLFENFGLCAHKATEWENFILNFEASYKAWKKSFFQVGSC